MEIRLHSHLSSGSRSSSPTSPPFKKRIKAWGKNVYVSLHFGLLSPISKTCPPHFSLHHGSSQALTHGGKVASALGTLRKAQMASATHCELSDLYTYDVQVDLVNFKLLSQGFWVDLAMLLISEAPQYHRYLARFLTSIRTER
uniref:Uncharacterized protein n=1 Tax=Crocodylus porosus TaxID=8502 RepID=A0A7M4E259_CROPO